jgi:hypothetical protein
MSFFQEYSLLVVAATPVALIAAINVHLWLSGERGTLVLPGVMSFPRMAMDAGVPIPVDVAPATDARVGAVAANDEHRMVA